MKIDWLVVATIVGPLIGAAIIVSAARLSERGPKLLTWFSHSSAVVIRPQQAEGVTQTQAQAQGIRVHTHTFVIRNAGRKPAHNVRLGHTQLPNFSVHPSVAYTISALPEGGSEIVLPILVSNELITITYLYYPPLLHSQIHTYAKCDEGMAQSIPIQISQVYPPWAVRLIGFFLFLGLSTTLYLILRLVLWIFHQQK